MVAKCLTGKAKYETEEAASFEIARRHRLKLSPELSCYFCHSCYGWHLTSQVTAKKIGKLKNNLRK